MPDVPKQLGELSAVDGFIKTVLKSGLLNPRQVEEARSGAPAEVRNDPKALAELLVKSGKLTRFQSGKLLAGISLGLVFGPYHILNAIGRGGMGSVFLARDSRDQRLVAVKVLPPKKAKAQERLVARFKREMEICQRVSHPHLTKTFEVGTHLNVNYIAMEYIPGKTMYWLVKEQGPIKVPRAARLFAEVALGLDHAHAQGLIHRDLKPSNIMVMPDDRAKILDMGLALMEGEDEPTILHAKGHLVGTPDYLAPEQADDPLKVDFRSDIYSLGCTLYFVLTGSAPFSGGGTLQKMLRHRTEAPVPVGQINPSVPAAFASLLTHMLAKRPEHRYKSAAALRDALLPWATEPGMERKIVPVADGKKPAEPEPVPVATPAEPPPVAVLLTEPARQGVPIAEPAGKLPPPGDQAPAAKPRTPTAPSPKPPPPPESPVSSKPAPPLPPRPPAPETSAPPTPPASTKPALAPPRLQPEAGPPRLQQQPAGPLPAPPRPAAEAGPASASRPAPVPPPPAPRPAAEAGPASANRPAPVSPPPAPPRPAAEAGPASTNRPAPVSPPPAPPRPAAEAGPASANRPAPVSPPPAPPRPAAETVKRPAPVETDPSPLLQRTTIDPNILASLATPQEEATPSTVPETPFAVDFLLPVLFSGFILAGLWVLLMLLLLRM